MTTHAYGLFAMLLAVTAVANASEPKAAALAQATGASIYDPALAKQTGADERGMRSYILVVLKTGPKRVPDGDKRDTMFAGHFANMDRLSKEGKLVLAGPFAKDPDGWRGLFVFAVKDIGEAKALVATDPVIINGEMVAEYHNWYGTAATMLIPALHEKLQSPSAK